MCKQSACMTDQVTDTKSGTQSGLFTDCFTDSITGLKFDNRTDASVWGVLALYIDHPMVKEGSPC